jgi:hypothetical protein
MLAASGLPVRVQPEPADLTEENTGQSDSAHTSHRGRPRPD